MTAITFISPSGKSRSVPARVGQTLMEVALMHAIEEIEAACGGACSCATCHVMVEDGWNDRLDPPQSLELEMLEAVEDRGPSSRLSCQIKIRADLDGLVVTTPANQG